MPEIEPAVACDHFSTQMQPITVTSIEENPDLEPPAPAAQIRRNQKPFPVSPFQDDAREGQDVDGWRQKC